MAVCNFVVSRIFAALLIASALTEIVKLNVNGSMKIPVYARHWANKDGTGTLITTLTDQKENKTVQELLADLKSDVTSKNKNVNLTGAQIYAVQFDYWVSGSIYLLDDSVKNNPIGGIFKGPLNTILITMEAKRETEWGMKKEFGITSLLAKVKSLSSPLKANTTSDNSVPIYIQDVPWRYYHTEGREQEKEQSGINYEEIDASMKPEETALLNPENTLKDLCLVVAEVIKARMQKKKMKDKKWEFMASGVYAVKVTVDGNGKKNRTIIGKDGNLQKELCVIDRRDRSVYPIDTPLSHILGDDHNEVFIISHGKL
ncbi:hypothetical protein DdX_21365 [Ditylenchus destructor]|uniref:Uncharacterized protein n=1 Tax=Ditylenchus destructor TaxID=166010 RepID=A0AAD4MJ79_9BILA|nr:hypothetical protein DdX_21365 [Ditylenchus destructor]